MDKQSRTVNELYTLAEDEAVDFELNITSATKPMPLGGMTAGGLLSSLPGPLGNLKQMLEGGGGVGKFIVTTKRILIIMKKRFLCFETGRWFTSFPRQALDGRLGYEKVKSGLCASTLTLQIGLSVGGTAMKCTVTSSDITSDEQAQSVIFLLSSKVR